MGQRGTKGKVAQTIFAVPDWLSVPDRRLGRVVDDYHAVMEIFLKALGDTPGKAAEMWRSIRREAGECWTHWQRGFHLPTTDDYRAVI